MDINITLIKEIIVKRCAYLKALGFKRWKLHQTIIDILVETAGEFGMEAVAEYRLPPVLNSVNQDSDRQRYIDVVWLSDSEPVAAFEVDSSLRRKSPEKLLRIQAHYLFWIYYGCKNPAEFVDRFDTGKQITVITVPSAETFSNSLPPDILPGTIGDINLLYLGDLLLQQAVRHIALALPASDRSPKLIRKIAERILLQSLDELGDVCITPVKSNSKCTVDYRLELIRTRYPRAYERWKEEDDRLLMERYETGITVKELAEFFERQPGAIRSRLKKLELI